MAEATTAAVIAPGRLSGLQKAAIVLLTLGPTESAHLLKHVSQADADQCAKGIAQLERVTPEQVQESLEEFHQQTHFESLYLKGGLEYARKMLTEAYGPSIADDLVERLSKNISNEALNFENFRKADPQQLSKFIQDEHPQTVALILSHLDPTQAADLISGLPIEVRTDIAIRMADLDQISPEIVRSIASVIDQKLRNLGELSRESYGGVRAVASILNRLDPEGCSQLMDSVEQANPALSESIRRFMFVFKDLEDVDKASLTAIVQACNRTTLVTALKGANESLRQKFMATQSQRGAAMLADDLAALGPVRLREVEAAQQEIITLARDLEKEGSVNLKNATTEQYVY